MCPQSRVRMIPCPSSFLFTRFCMVLCRFCMALCLCRVERAWACLGLRGALFFHVSLHFHSIGLPGALFFTLTVIFKTNGTFLARFHSRACRWLIFALACVGGVSVRVPFLFNQCSSLSIFYFHLCRSCSTLSFSTSSLSMFVLQWLIHSI